MTVSAGRAVSANLTDPVLADLVEELAR